MAKWSKKIPEVKGPYWFHGWEFEFERKRGDPPQTYFVDIRGCANGVLRFLRAHNMDVKEATGVWMPVDLPEPPEVIE